MRSPRKLRPDSITIYTPREENDEGKVLYDVYYIQHVRYDGNYGISQSQRGIEDKNTVLVVIDMNDFKATDEFGTVITSLGDLLIKGKTLVSYGKQEEMDRKQCVIVNEVKPLHALSTKIHFLEVYCS